MSEQPMLKHRAINSPSVTSLCVGAVVLLLWGSKGMERVGGGVYINVAWRGMKRLLAITLSLILAGCATPQMSKKMLDLSTAPTEVIVEQIKRGEFDWHITSDMSFADQRSVVCDWVMQGKRDAVEALLQTAGGDRRDYLNTLPLLACSRNEEDYAYYKRLNAPHRQYEKTAQYKFEWNKWSSTEYLPTPLTEAAANGNFVAVSLLIKDGAEVDQVGRAGITPLGYALGFRNGYLRNLENVFRQGRWPGMLAGNSLYIYYPSDDVAHIFSILAKRARFQPDTIVGLDRVIRIILESLDGAETSLTIDFRRINGLHSSNKLSDTFSFDATFMRELARVHELRRAMSTCYQGRGDGCRDVAASADPLSSMARDAQGVIAKTENEEREWNSLLVAQRCRVQGKNWLYEGSACANGMAQGAGRARSRDRQIVVDGQFEKGLFLSGRLTVGGSPSYEGGFSNWEPEGMGICWHQGRPEECRMQAGARIDSLHKQRVENERLRRERASQEKEEAQARREREWEAERRHRAQQEEERRERRNERALAAGIAAMRGGNSGQTAPNSSLDSTLRMVQQQNQLIAQGNAEIQRVQAQREARRDEIRRDAAQQEAERRAPDQVQKRQAVQHVANEEATRAQQQKDADDKRARDEAARRIREEEARRQQEIQATAARREAERLQRERDRQAEQQELDRLKSDYLRAVKDGVRMKAVSCAGSHYVTGTRPRVREPAHMSSCVDVAVMAWCPGDRTGRALVATNFVGMSGCLGDTYKIEPKPACEAEQMRVVVEDVRPCR